MVLAIQKLITEHAQIFFVYIINLRNPILICLNRELQREGEEESGQLDLEDTLQLGASRPFAVVF